MAAVFDIAGIRHRAAATRSRFTFAAEDERARNAKLADVLEAVEATLLSQQETAEHFEQRQLALRELRRLSGALHDTRAGPRRLLWRLLHPKSFSDRAALIDRLDRIIAAMSQEGRPDRDAKRPSGRRPAPRPVRTGIAVALATVTGLLIAGTLAAVKFSSAGVDHALGGAATVSQFGDETELAEAGARPQPDPLAGPAKAATDDGAAGKDLGPPRYGLQKNGATAQNGSHGSHSDKKPVSQGQAFTPPRPALQAVLQTVPAVRTNKLAAPVTQAAFVPMLTYDPDKEVRLLLAHAKKQAAVLALTTPEGDNAYETYQLALSIQPDNPAALAGIEWIGLKYVELSKLAAAKGDFAKADLYAAKAREFAPEHASVRSMSEPEPSDAPPSDDTAMAAVNEPVLDFLPPMTINSPEAVDNVGSFIGLPPATAGASSLGGHAAIPAAFRPPRSQQDGSNLGLDAEILEMSPLVVPVYPGDLFVPSTTPNERNRSHDHDVASARRESSRSAGSSGGSSRDSGSGDAGSGDGGSGGGGSGDGGSGDGGSGDGGSGGGGSGDGGSGDGGSGDGGSGGGNGNGNGGNGGGNGNGNGGGNGNGNGNGRN